MNEPRDFWSRRKARVAEEAEAEKAAFDAQAIEAEQTGKSDEEILTHLGLPDPDTMIAGDDFSGFMAKAVPQRLRTRALRKLWLTNPLLANVDGLVDYGEDFTDAACVIENLQTTYQVGKGMAAHVEEMARQAEAAEEETVAEEEVEESPAVDEADDAADDDDLILSEDSTDEEADLHAQQTELLSEEFPAPAPRRRMHFSFETNEVTNA